MPTTPVKKFFTYTLKDIYSIYRKERRKYVKRVSKIIPRKTHEGIIQGFLMKIMNKVVNENFSWMLPYSLGLQVVKSRKTNYDHAKVNFNKTRDLSKVVKYLNQHTFGFYYYLWWNKSYVSFRNHPYYKFTFNDSPAANAVGAGKGALSQLIFKTAEEPLIPSYTRI